MKASARHGRRAKRCRRWGQRVEQREGLAQHREFHAHGLHARGGQHLAHLLGEGRGYNLCPRGWMGRPLEPLGIKVAFTPIGIIIALTFIGLPFVVRTVQPVLEDLGTEIEEVGCQSWSNSVSDISACAVSGTAACR